MGNTNRDRTRIKEFARRRGREHLTTWQLTSQGVIMHAKVTAI